MAGASKYKKLDQREHVLKRPGLYIGGIHPDTVDAWVWRNDEIRFGNVKYSPGFVQIFLEVLTNAVDHAYRTKVTEIRIHIDIESGSISVQNDGDGIDTSVIEESEEKIRGPQLVFGHMLSSSNFDDDNTRFLAGQNGVGSKATNIFSSEFHVETLDSASTPKVLYNQTWRNNMTECDVPIIEKLKGKQKPYTKVTYRPDFKRFHMNGIDPDTMAVLSKCALDASAVTPSHTSVYLNGSKLPIKTFKDYCGLFVESGGGSKSNLVFDKSSDGDWEIGACVSPDGFRQVSFVNGLCTPRGGKHVDHVVTAIAKKLSVRLTTKAKTVTNRIVKNAMWVFVKGNVPDPMFDSQNKHTLTTPADKFKSKYEASDIFLKNLVVKTGIADRINLLGIVDDESKLKKSDGAQRRTVTGIPKLEDATAAGGPESNKCTLILCEGDSARSWVISGLAAIGRKYYGCYPLKGKPLNTRDASASKIGENQEIKDIKKIMGLETGKDYSTPEARKTLRFGKGILLATDSDLDGVHIAMLCANIFHTMWPSLMRIPGFVSVLRTPVVISKKGKVKIPFFTLQDFEKWREGGGDTGFSNTYIKGLGLLSSEDARQFLGNDRKVYNIRCDPTPPKGDDEGATRDRVYVKLLITASQKVKVRLDTEDLPKNDDDALDMAFRKTRAEDRKVWLNTFDKLASLPDDEEVSTKDYVQKCLAHFSWDDVQRSLPHVVDGLKESLRKILFAVKERPANASHIRVAQMAAYVGQVSAYRHGEASLQGAIVGMAQNYVGCGHVQLLEGEGQFGTRIMGGKDSASPRYIHCDIHSITNLMFPVADEPVLQRNLDDDMKPIEAKYYVPVLPLLLLNGSVGIGTGYSTSVPCFNPRLIAEAYRERIRGDTDALLKLRDIRPYYRGFLGGFLKNPDNGKWMSRGVFEKIGKTIRITELPLGVWSQDYKVFLEDLCSNNKIGLKRYDSNYTDVKVDFALHFDSVASAAACDPYESLKLRADKLLSVSNMHALDSMNGVRRYESPADIAEEHYNERFVAYGQRLVLQRDHARKDLAFAEAKEGFVKDVIERAIDIGNAPESLISEHASKRGWPKIEGGAYDYLSGMPISSLTKERHQRLVGDVERKRARLAELLAATIEGTWLQEINAVMALMA